MPIPFLIAAAVAVVAGGSAVAGIAGHVVAKETNETAKNIIDKAQRKYDNAKVMLNEAQDNAQQAVTRLMNEKQIVFETSMKEFIDVYNRVKHIKLSESSNLSELDKFRLDEDSFVQLQEMTSNNNALISTVGTTAVSVAGTSAVAGVLGVGSIVAFSAIAGPAFLVSAFLADNEANKNIEKANVFEAEVDVKVDEMKISNALCNAIIDKSNMNYTLLKKLITFFVPVVNELDKLTLEKSNGLKNIINQNMLTEKDLELIAVSRSLAGAVKQVIDSPLLNCDGTLNSKNEETIEEVSSGIHDFDKRTKTLSIDVYRLDKDSTEEISSELLKLKEEINTIVTDIRNLYEETKENISFEILDISSKNAKKLLNCLLELCEAAEHLSEVNTHLSIDMLMFKEGTHEEKVDRLSDFTFEATNVEFNISMLALKISFVDRKDLDEILDKLSELNKEVSTFSLGLRNL